MEVLSVYTKKMRVQRYVVLLSAVIATRAALCENGVEASSGDEEGPPETLDAADFDFEEDFAATPSLSELAKREHAQQKKMYEQEGPEGDEQFVVGDDEPEAPPDEAQNQAAVSAEEQDIDALDNLDDLEEREEDKQQEKPEESPGEVGETPGSSPVTSTESPTKYEGQVVQTKDEEGTELDTSSLNRQDEHSTSTVSEFVDAVPTFKKEEEKKEKKKEDHKRRKEANNEIDIYEREIKAFSQVQEKNKDRFKDEVENAEKDLQAPKNPGWWRRLRHWYNVKMNKLVDKYGSDKKD